MYIKAVSKTNCLWKMGRCPKIGSPQIGTSKNIFKNNEISV